MKKVTKFPGGQVSYDTEAAESILKAIAGKFAAQVGILGNKTLRNETGSVMKKGGHRKARELSDRTNADVGLDHEKGVKSRNIPRRSFIELPLVTRRLDLNQVRLALWKAFAARKTSIQEAYLKLGIAAENLIQEAFETGGFGQWQPLKEATKKRKKSSAILIDTAQLRRSIDSRVVSK